MVHAIIFNLMGFESSLQLFCDLRNLRLSIYDRRVYVGPLLCSHLLTSTTNRPRADGSKPNLVKPKSNHNVVVPVKEVSLSSPERKMPKTLTMPQEDKWQGARGSSYMQSLQWRWAWSPASGNILCPTQAQLRGRELRAMSYELGASDYV